MWEYQVLLAQMNASNLLYVNEFQYIFKAIPVLYCAQYIEYNTIQARMYT